MDESNASCNEPLSDQWSQERILEFHLKPLLDQYDIKNRGHGRIYVDHEEHNILAANKVISDLSIILRQPSASIRARLIELEWLRDVRETLPNPNEIKRAELLGRVSGERDVDHFYRDEEF